MAIFEEGQSSCRAGLEEASEPGEEPVDALELEVVFPSEIGLPEYLLPDASFIGEKAIRERISSLQEAMEYINEKKRKWKEEADFLVGCLEEMRKSPQKKGHVRSYSI